MMWKRVGISQFGINSLYLPRHFLNCFFDTDVFQRVKNAGAKKKFWKTLFIGSKNIIKKKLVMGFKLTFPVHFIK